MFKRYIFSEDLIAERCLHANLGIFYAENTVLNEYLSAII